MESKHIGRFNLLGFEVRAHVSWLVLLGALSWSFATQVFPSYFAYYSTSSYWTLGIATALGLMVSIVFHELSHSLAARRRGIEVKNITLFMFGGMADTGEEPRTPKEEFLIAIVGPLFSFALGFVLTFLSALTDWMGLPLFFVDFFAFMATLNFTLAVFNLVPAFPLDGGRVLRALLWKVKNDLTWATKITVGLGVIFGIFLMVTGALAAIAGEFVGGVWYILLGNFIRMAAKSSSHHELLTKLLQKEPVTQIMHKWEEGRAQEILPALQTITPETDALHALEVMNHAHVDRLYVSEHGRVVGTVTLRDIIDFFAIKRELAAHHA